MDMVIMIVDVVIDMVATVCEVMKAMTMLLKSK